MASGEMRIDVVDALGLVEVLEFVREFFGVVGAVRVFGSGL
ncbi:hypothetical protein OH799_33880 [Nocardia sp. NBC_00881]|nr:hypothetical protein OH799_33880 [Nocardia sp. NBC_00881]